MEIVGENIKQNTTNKASDVEYNKLTNDLLAAGYDAEHFPEYVRIPEEAKYYSNPLDNADGGFIYNRSYSLQFRYRTDCGLDVSADSVIDNLSYMGKDYTIENECPVILCPYNISNCQRKKDFPLNEEGVLSTMCACSKTESYNYENSVEKVEHEYEDMKKRKYQEYSDTHDGRVCINQMQWNKKTMEWSLKYKPLKCVHCSQKFCPVLKKKLSNKRGNVYFDIKSTYYIQDGSFFDGKEVVSIERNKRFFNQPCSIDICENFIKMQKDEIYRKLYWNSFSQFLMYDRMREKPTGLRFEIINIRAISRPSRNIEEDLQILKEGGQVFYTEDNEKILKEAKKDRKIKRQQRIIKKLEDNIIDNGFETLSISERKMAEKLIPQERLKELNDLYEKKEPEPVQLTFDFL